MTEVPQIVIPAAQFASLASGYGDEAAMRTLHEGQISLRLLLLGRVLGELRQAAGDSSEAAMIEASVGLLICANDREPAAVADVLTSPHVRAWLDRSEADLLATVTDVCARLASLAASAAIRAGIDFELEFPSGREKLFLPMIGAFGGLSQGAVHLARNGRHLRCRVGAHSVSVEAPFEIAGPGWQPLRRIGGSPAPAIILDDLDPDRDCYQWQPLSRLSDPDAQSAEQKWIAAWAHLAAHYPEYVPAVRALRAIVPLTPSPVGGGAVSATSSNAFGAVALCLPDDTPTLVELIIHEAQHVRLHGLLDLVDLYVTDATYDYYAPWRIDSRPIGPFLQGIYAHLGVCDFWRRRRHLAPTVDRPLAELEFALWRLHLSEALTTVAASTELTDLGKRFVAGLAATMGSWCEEVVTPGAERVAGDVAMAHRLRWDAGRTQTSLPAGPLRVRFATAARQWLAQDHGAHRADLLLAAGDYEAASNAFAANLQHQEDLDDRIGLAIARSRLCGQSAWHS